MNSDLVTKPIPRRVPPRERFTYAEFCSRVQEQKADLINGEVFLAPPATRAHEDFLTCLHALLRFYVRVKALGMVIGSRVAMKLSEYDAPEPDLMFIKKERLHLLGETEIFGPADLVVEVISPGSRRLDFVDKRELYANFGVLEYWLIDLYKQQAFFWKNVNGIWEDLPVDENGIVRSEVLTGFWLREDSTRPVVLVAGGTGFAPIKAIVEHAAHTGTTRPLTLYWGSRDRAGLYLDELAGAWQTTIPGFTYIPVLSDAQPGDAWDGRTGLVHQAVLDDFADLSGHEVYACGAPAMIDAARSSFIGTRGLSEEHFFADAFTFATPAN